MAQDTHLSATLLHVLCWPLPDDDQQQQQSPMNQQPLAGVESVWFAKARLVRKPHRCNKFAKQHTMQPQQLSLLTSQTHKEHPMRCCQPSKSFAPAAGVYF